MVKKRIRQVKGKNGRIYEYDFPAIPTGGKRRPYQHHPDFRPKVKHTKKEWSFYHQRGLRIQCLARDNFSCQICHKISQFPDENYRDLNIHHKDNKGYGHTPYPNNSLDNLVTLCDSCHLQLHYDVLEKHKSIVALRNEGFTFQAIGEKFGVSRQRIFQIFMKSL